MRFNLLDGWFQFPIGEIAFDAVFGFFFVFTGILLLILIFTLLGFVMKKFNARQETRKNKNKKEASAPVAAAVQEEGISPEVVAAISAAVAAFYEGEQVQCDFVVKRIKKL